MTAIKEVEKDCKETKTCAICIVQMYCKFYARESQITAEQARIDLYGENRNDNLRSEV